MCAAAHGWVGLGRIVYVTSSEQLGIWLALMGVSRAPVPPPGDHDIIPDLVVAGPVPDLAEQVRDLHRRFPQRSGTARSRRAGPRAALRTRDVRKAG